ncbi:shugoshin-1-like [Pistacia vera]|uniref:shugoshin-1-like n=1 Tax=Pistacia vera TaxID=55513 RepID=UPI0012634CF1|nr:shugoshin-1-like [Pistacia vera]
MKGERMAKRSTFGSIVRKRLSDITNSQSHSQPKALTHEDKPSQVSPATEDLISKLIKEKMTLMKLIDERNKIIELSGNELQNLKINLQKLQLQNWNLAQSNSQMQAELNLGREKTKALQHELLCKEALLKAKNMEKEVKTDLNCANTGFQEGEDVAGECLPKANDDDKPCSRNRRRAARSKSMGPSTTHRIVGDKEKIENKRRCLRRQSARFKSLERGPTENLFEIEDTKLPATQPLDDPMQEDGFTQVGSSTATTEETCGLRNKVQVPQRSSIGRPLRRAAEKVQSYKEVPLNVKMRRSG